MVLVRDVTVGEGESVAPGTRFVKTWRVQNPGPDRWPPGCILRCQYITQYSIDMALCRKNTGSVHSKKHDSVTDTRNLRSASY